MLSRVLRTIRRHDLFVGPRADRVLCAVSGGPDSMALLAVLWELGARLGLTLEVATVDHGLRPEAAKEMSLVEERAAALGLPWHGVRVDVAGALTQTGETPARRRGGLQEVARRLRLAALAELAVARGLGRVALGHQADDQTETVLFRILRGTGIAGLTGIPYRRDPFVRPLLDVTRAEIHAYLERRSLPYASDPSNADLRYTRARLRHRILPLLRQENPRVDEAIRSLAARAMEAASGSPIGAFMREATTAGVHVPIRVAAQIAEAAEQGNGTRGFDVAAGRKVTVSYGRVRLDEVRPPEPAGTDVPHTPVRIDGAGTYPWGVGEAIVVHEVGPDRVGFAGIPGSPAAGVAEPAEPGDNDGPSPWIWFDGAQLAWPLWVRQRRPGDRMRPRGGIGSRTVADLMIDAHIPKGRRASVPVVTSSDGEPLFVPSLRPSRRGEPSPETRRWVGLALGPSVGHDALVDPSIFGSNTQSERFLKEISVEVDK